MISSLSQQVENLESERTGLAEKIDFEYQSNRTLRESIHETEVVFKTTEQQLSELRS